jgi:hypothetical protein
MHDKRPFSSSFAEENEWHQQRTKRVSWYLEKGWEPKKAKMHERSPREHQKNMKIFNV